MGRGIAYSYQYFMLFDYDHKYFKLQPEDVSEVSDGLSDDGEFFEGYLDDFLHDIAGAFGTELEQHPSWIGREARIIAETDRLQVGIDSSGGLPCIFVQPKTYVPWNSTDPFNEKDYNIRRDVTKAFTALIKLYSGQKDPMFRYPTSAWTSSPYVSGKFVA